MPKRKTPTEPSSPAACSDRFRLPQIGDEYMWHTGDRVIVMEVRGPMTLLRIPGCEYVLQTTTGTLGSMTPLAGSLPQVECQACGEVRDARLDSAGHLLDECDACGSQGNMVALDTERFSVVDGEHRRAGSSSVCSAWACVADCPNRSERNICIANTRRNPPFKCQIKPNAGGQHER